MLVLKQSTSVDIRMGPFVDATDGVTPETGITIGAADQAEVLKAGGAATVAMTGTLAAVTGADGWYDYTVQTGDVDTVGEVVFVIQDSSVCLPVFVRAQVVEETVYDALFASSAAGELAVKLSTQGKADVNAEADTALADYDPPTAAELTAEINDVQNNIAALNDPTAAAIADAVWDEDATGHQTAGTFGEALGDPAASGNSVRDLIAALNDLSAAEVNAECDTAIADASLATAASITALNDISVSDILTTQMTESYHADGTAPTLAQALFAIMQQAGEFSISGTTITVKKLDGSTTAMTFTLDDANNPTSRTRAT